MYSKRRYFIFITIGLALNIAGHFLNTLMKSPLFLDSIGAILSGAVLGPWIGAGVGFLSNVILGVWTNHVMIPFGIVNAAIGMIAGFIAMKRGFEDAVTPLMAALLIGVVSPVMATPIAVYLFGGFTGGGLDRFVASLMQSGQTILTSAFLARIPANIADKLISCYLVFLIIRFLPINQRGVAVHPSNRKGRPF